MTDSKNSDEPEKIEEELEEAPEELETGDDQNATSDTDDVVFDEDSKLGTQETIKKLRAKLKTAVEEKQAYLNGWQRDKAEFVNARKRDEEAKTDFLKFSKQGIIEEILPVLDSFDMALGKSDASGAAKEVPKEWRDGVERIQNQFMGILAKHGVKAFGEVGDAFDPNLHHSIGMVKTENKDDDHKVAEILQKGYLMQEKVVRPALVKVFEA